MPIWLALLLIAASFVAGFVCGGILLGAVIADMERFERNGRDQTPPGAFPDLAGDSVRLLACALFVMSALPWRWAPWLVQFVGDLALVAAGVWFWTQDGRR